MALSVREIRQILQRQNDAPVDDFRIYDSWAEYKPHNDKGLRPLEYLCYEIEAMQPDTGKKEHLFKAIKFFRVIRLPQSAKESLSFMDMQSQILASAWANKYNIVGIIANILSPEPLGLLYLCGVQGVGTTIAAAKEQADHDFAGFRALYQGTFRQLHIRAINARETEWLREKMDKMQFITALRGIPKANEGGEDAGNKGIGGANLNPASQGTIEEFIAGMADYEYVIQVLATHVYEESLYAWQNRIATQMTAFNDQLQGTKSIGLSLSLPAMFSGTTSNSQGWSHAYTKGSGNTTTIGNSFGTSFGQAVGQSLTRSFGESFNRTKGVSVTNGVSQTHSVSHGTGTSTTFSQGLGRNTGYSVNEGIGSNRGVGANMNTGLSQNASIGQNASSGLNRSHGSGMNFGSGYSSGGSMTGGRTATNSESFSGNSSQNVSGNNSVSVNDSLNGTQGISDSNAQSHSTSGSDGVSNGGSGGANVSAVVVGANGSYSGSRTHSRAITDANSSTLGNSSSIGQGLGISNGAGTGNGASMGFSNGLGASNGRSTSYGSNFGTSGSMGQNFSDSIGASHSVGGSLSEGTGLSKSTGLSFSEGSSTSSSIGRNTGASASASESHGFSESTSESYGTSVSKSVGHSQSESYGQSASTGTSESATESNSVNNGSSTSRGSSTSSSLSDGTSGTFAMGGGSTLGLAAGISINKSSQWLDANVQYILEMLKYQHGRAEIALQGDGAFNSYVYIACPTTEALAAAQALAKSTWQNKYTKVQPLQVLDLSYEQQRHLLWHFYGFSADITQTQIDGLRDYMFCTRLLPHELTAYTHLPRISEGGIYANVENIPPFATPSMLPGEIYIGNVISSERWTYEHNYLTRFEYRIPEAELMHGFFTGASRSGKTVCAMRFAAELTKITRKQTGKRLRILCMDPKQDWRALSRYVQPEEDGSNRFRFYSMADTKFHPLKYNPCKVPRGVSPNHWMGALVDVFCRAYGLAERGKQIISDILNALYEEAGVFEAWDGENWQETRKFVPDLSAKVTFTALYEGMLKQKLENETGKGKRGQMGRETADAFARMLERLSCFSREHSIERVLFGTSAGIGIDELLGDDDITVLESKGLESTFRSFIFGAMTAGIYRYAINQPDGFLAPDQYETVMIIEEANEVLTGNDNSKGGSDMTRPGSSEFEQMLDQAAGYGLFVFAITQKISDMPKSVIANAGLKFCGRVPTDDDINTVVRSIARDPRYDDRPISKWFPRAPTGYFVCQSSRTSDIMSAEPVLVSVAMLPVSPPSNIELDQILRRNGHMRHFSAHKQILAATT